MSTGYVSARPGIYRLAGRLSYQMPLRRIVHRLLTESPRNFGEASLLTVVDRAALKVFFTTKAEPAGVHALCHRDLPWRRSPGAPARAPFSPSMSEAKSPKWSACRPSPSMAGRRMVRNY